MYGPGDNYHPENSHVLPAFVRRFQEAKDSGAHSVTCWGSGSPLREFLHVDDLGNACVFALESWHPKIDESMFLNVGTGIDLSIKELAIATANAVGFEGEILWDKSRPDGTPKKQLDISKLRSLGWTATIPLQEGLDNTVQLYQNQLEKDSSKLRLH